MIRTIALLAAATAPLALPPKGAEFEGATAQRGAISFVISRDGTRVLNFTVSVRATCKNVGATVDARKFKAMKLFRDGSFSGVVRDVPPHVVPQGGRMWVRGRFDSRTHVRGSVNLIARRPDPAGGVAFCQSGTLSWSASLAR